jgi:acetyl-CoA C-acetyltransferase
MTRAPFVMGKADSAFSRQASLQDTTMGWRFINPKLKEMYGVDTMPETAENVAEAYSISREDQDRFALASQRKFAAAAQLNVFAREIVPVLLPQSRRSAVAGDPLSFARDEHPRETTLEALAGLRGVVRPGGTVTAGNASGINDGACALLLASGEAASRHGLTPIARIVGMATAGVEPHLMGIGPVPAVRKLLERLGMPLAQMDVLELNEAFAAQALAVARTLGLQDDDPRINPNGGAIALGHPLGMSGARLLTTAAYQLRDTGGRYALCTMCIGVGQGIAVVIERV